MSPGRREREERQKGPGCLWGLPCSLSSAQICLFGSCFIEGLFWYPPPISLRAPPGGGNVCSLGHRRAQRVLSPPPDWASTAMRSSVSPTLDWEHPESENHPSFSPCVKSLGVRRVDKLLRESPPYRPSPRQQVPGPTSGLVGPPRDIWPSPCACPMELSSAAALSWPPGAGLGWVAPPSQGEEGAGLDRRPVGSLSKA